jgi:hypothetical protein
MSSKCKKISIDGVDYVRADAPQPVKTDGDYVIVRTYSAGVHAGYLESRTGREVVLRNTRRIWYWDGANTLSDLASKGTSKPDKCKFPAAIDKILLTEAIEVIPCTDRARESIEGVPIWVT